MATVTVPDDPVERLLLDEALKLRPHPVRPVALEVAEAATLVTLAERSSSGCCALWVDSLRLETGHRTGADQELQVRPAFDDKLLGGADLVILRLPRSLDLLDELAAAVARYAAPDVALLAGGRVKYLTRSMSSVLGGHFGSVRASLGRQKSRVLIATDPRPDRPAPAPTTRHHADLDLTVVAYAGVFAGAGIDLGTRALLEALVVPAEATLAADLGCGTGVLASALVRRSARLRVVASDDTHTACWSATATAAANGAADRITVRRADLLAGVDDAAVDLVVCNPPFHRGTAKDSTDAFAMITEAARCLRPGGELWFVYNAHLPYLPALMQQVGPTAIARRTDRYLVTRSVRRERDRSR